MSNDFKDHEEAAFVRKYEEMLRNHTRYFFDVEAYELIVEHYISSGKLEEAYKAVSLAIEQYPYSTELLTGKARLLLDLGKPNKSLDVLEKISHLQPNDLDSSLLRSTAYSLTGRFEEAIELLLHMLQWQVAQDEIYYHLGITYQGKGDFEEAITYYKKAIGLNMQNEAAILELSYCLEYLNRLEELIPFYEQFIDQDPYAHQAWFNLGEIHMRMDRYEEAIQAFEYATLIKPDFERAFFYLGCAYLNLEKYQDAQACFLSAVDLYEGNDPDLLCHLAATYEKLEQYEIAIKYYQRAIRANSTWDEGWYGVGICLDAIDRWLEALHFLRKAKELDDNNANYWLAFANIEYKIGHVLSSLEAYERAAELAPYNKEIWFNWSYLYYEQGNYEQAVNILEGIIDDMPDEADLQYRLVAYLIEAGRYKEAFNHLENALLLDYDQHTLLYEFFTELETQKALYKIIEQYRHD